MDAQEFSSESGISRCKLLHAAWINKVLLISTGGASQMALVVKDSPANTGDRRLGFDP